MTKKSEISNFWNDAHVDEKRYELTGSAPEQILTFLNLPKDLISKSKKILVIGVGFGHELKFFHSLGKDVSILDISEIALKKFSSFSSKQFLPSQLATIRGGQYDLIVSYLVTQHMNNAELEHQLKECIRLLKINGIFAMQFASKPSMYDDYGKSIKLQKQMNGLVTRSLPHIELMILSFKGKVTWKSLPIYLPHYNHFWYGIHIMRADANEILESTATAQFRWLYRFAKYCTKLFTSRLLSKLS